MGAMAKMRAPKLRLVKVSQGFAAAMLAALALVLGGGGSPNPLAEMALQIGAVAVFVVYLWAGHRQVGPAYAVPPQVYAIIALVLALPVLHLIPLPPEIWQNLPDRSRDIAALALIERQDSWRPLSIAPPNTLASLLALIPPLMLAWMVARLGLAERRVILAAIALAAIGSALLGTLQMADIGDGYRLYPDAHLGWLTGFHANRNAAADVLLIGGLAALGWFASREQRDRIDHMVLLASALAVLVAALLFTGSRAGIALLPIAALGGFAMLRSPDGGGRINPWLGGLALISLLLMAAGAAALFDPRLGFVASRFGITDDFRIELWRDSMDALAASWPWGSGVGTFAEAFLPYERLDVVDPTMPNRAHNDYLELAIEAGALGLAVLLACTVLIAGLAWPGLKVRGPARAMTLFGLTSFILIALHALVDYPLRNMAEACLAGIALGMLAAPRRARPESVSQNGSMGLETAGS